MCSLVIICTSLITRVWSPFENVLKKYRGCRESSLADGEWREVCIAKWRLLGLIGLVVSEIKVKLFHCSWPVYEITSDSLSLWEFGGVGWTLCRLCGMTETVWEVVRDMHGMIYNFSHSLQLHRETQKVEHTFEKVQYLSKSSSGLSN